MVLFEDCFGFVTRVEHAESGDGVVDVVQFEFEACDDSEVPAASNRPEQVCVLGFAGGNEFTGWHNDVNAFECVNCKTVFASKPTDAAAKGATGDANVTGAAGWGGEVVLCGFSYEVFGTTPWFDACGFGGGVDVDAVHFTEVDDESVVDE